jgi:hypothetical protein
MSLASSFPAIRPALLLDFANAKTLDPRVTFTRASSATFYDKDGVLRTAASGVPRFTFDPVTEESLGLLIEESRTNLFTYSEQFDNAFWTKSGATIAANTEVSPDGNATADKLTEDATTSTHYAYVSFAPVSGTAYTYSIFAKAAGRTTFRLNAGGGWGITATFDLSAVTATLNSGTSTSITPVGNGWFRCSVTGTASSATSGQLQIILQTGTYAGDGTSGIFIWGAQLEAGSFATSYIATAGSQVTRSTDQASMTGANFSSWYNNAEGTFYANFVTSWSAALPYTVGVLGANSANERINYIPAGSSGISSFDGTTVSAITSSVLNINARVATGLVAATKQVSATLNGGSITTGSFSKTGVLSVFNIGSLSAGGGNAFSGTFKKIAYYPQRLTNAQLQALTA